MCTGTLTTFSIICLLDISFLLDVEMRREGLVCPSLMQQDVGLLPGRVTPKTIKKMIQTALSHGLCPPYITQHDETTLDKKIA